jgi:hypothetical protein
MRTRRRAARRRTGPAASVDDWAGITPTSMGHAVAKPTRTMATATTVVSPATSGITRSGNKIGSGVPARRNCSAAGKGVVPVPASRPILDIDGGAGGGQVVRTAVTLSALSGPGGHRR